MNATAKTETLMVVALAKFVTTLAGTMGIAFLRPTS